MKSLSGLATPPLANTTSTSSDIKLWFNSLLYNESKIKIWNISDDINVGDYVKFWFHSVK